MPISNIVDVQITRDTRSVSQAGFGTVLIAGTGAAFPELVRFYSNMDGVADDFAATDPEYLAANAVFSQTPKPSRIAIGKLQENSASVYSIDLNQDFQPGDSISVRVNGQTVTATTLTDLESAIAGVPGVDTATADNAIFTITITGDLGASLSVDNLNVTSTEGLEGEVSLTTAGNTAGGGLSLISQENDDWYAVVLATQSTTDQLDVARWAQSRRKIFFARSNDSGIIDSQSTLDIAARAKASGYDRTAVIYHDPIDDDFIDAAWLGKLLPEDPGAATFAFKSLAGVQVDNLTTSQQTAAQNKNANTYTEKGGANITEPGKMASGEYIDIMIGTDWLQARIQERVYSRLVNLKKIPYTDAGVAIIENEVRAQLQEGVNRGLLAANPPFQVSVPQVANVSQNDRANRFLPDITFTATLAGAIHKVQIRGTVSV